MSKKHTLSQLKKHDISQKVIDALADAESRSILFSTIRKGKTAMQLSKNLSIPLSTVYKKLTHLEVLALIRVEEWLISPRGRKYKVYRSMISMAEISIKKPEPVLNLIPN